MFVPGHQPSRARGSRIVRAHCSSRRAAAARPGHGEAADGQPARSPAAERRGAHPLRRAGRLLSRRPARRLHGQELRRRVRDRPRHARRSAASPATSRGRPSCASCTSRAATTSSSALSASRTSNAAAPATTSCGSWAGSRARARCGSVGRCPRGPRSRSGPRRSPSPSATRRTPRSRRAGTQLVVADLDPSGREAHPEGRARRLRERRPGVLPRGAGLLRRGPQAHLLLLRAGGQGERLDARPRHRRTGEPLRRDRLLQRGRGHLPRRRAHLRRERPPVPRLRRSCQLPQHRRLEAAPGRDRPRASPASPPSTTTRAGRPRTPSCRADGRLMAFQVARTADEAGVGYGILLLHLD